MSPWNVALRCLAMGSAANLLPAGSISAQAADDHYAIENARIVTVSGQTIDRGTLVVRAGVIQAVGSSVSVPAGAWVIDGSGLTVYPGLINGLSTVAMSSEDAPPPQTGGRGRGGGPNQGGPPPSVGPEDPGQKWNKKLALAKAEESNSSLY